MSNKKWYSRTHQFTPYTKADGEAVSNEFDAIQSSFERIPEMRDDGAGFAVSPIIPEPTNPSHPVTLGMLTASERSVNTARDDVTAKAKQVEQNAQTVVENTQTAINQANSATQSAASAAASSRSADESEGWAQKWASDPIDKIVSNGRYSAYHYASKAAVSAQNLSIAEQSARTNAGIAAQKAEEAKKSADRASSVARGEVDYGNIVNVPSASITTSGVVQLTNNIDSESESLGLTAKAGKLITKYIDSALSNLSGFIPNSKKSSAVNSVSTDMVANSLAVKLAYDKAVEAGSAAENAHRSASEAVPKSGGTMTGNLTVPNIIVNDAANNDNSVQIGDDAKFLDVDLNSCIGLQSISDKGKGYIAYGASKKIFGFDGARFFAESATHTPQHGYGAYSSQYNSNAPYMIDETGSVDRDTYHPFIKGRVRRERSYGAAFSFGYTSFQGQGDGFGRGIIHLIEDNGAQKIWQYEHNGDFISNGDVRSGNGKSLNSVLAPARLIWEGYTNTQLTVHLNSDKGILFVLGSDGNNQMWFSTLIEHCHGLDIGFSEYSWKDNQYQNLSFSRRISKNGLDITLSGRMIIRKIVAMEM